MRYFSNLIISIKASFLWGGDSSEVVIRRTAFDFVISQAIVKSNVLSQIKPKALMEIIKRLAKIAD